MDDLIYRQGAIDAVDERIQTLLKDEAFRQKCGDRDLYGVKKLLQNLPSVDVAPVMHGEWIKTTIAEPCGTDELHMTIYRDRETVKCSECGNPSPIYNIEFEFCPRCGAKMDGEK